MLALKDMTMDSKMGNRRELSKAKTTFRILIFAGMQWNSLPSIDYLPCFVSQQCYGGLLELIIVYIEQKQRIHPFLYE